MDLRPAATHTSETDGEHAQNAQSGGAATAETELPPPLTENEAAIQAIRTHRRASRILDVAHLRRLPASERIGALRQLRAEERQRTGEAASGEPASESGRRASVAQGVRSIFRIRQRSDAAPREVASASNAQATEVADGNEADEPIDEEARRLQLRREASARREAANIIGQRRFTVVI